MKTENIKAIFTNLLFVIGVILMITGFVRGTSTIAKSLIFDKYPLNSYEETKCELGTAPRVAYGEEIAGSANKETLEEREEKCLESLEQSRDVQQTEDIAYSVSFFVSGLALAMIFKRFIFPAKRQ